MIHGPYNIKPKLVFILGQINQVHALATDFFKIHFNVNFPSILRPSKCCHSHSFPHQNHICTSPLPPYVLHASPSLFFLIDN